MWLFENHKTSFSTVVDPQSWSDAGDTLELMSDPEEDEDDMPDDKDSTRSGESEVNGDGDGPEDGKGKVVVAELPGAT